MKLRELINELERQKPLKRDQKAKSSELEMVLTESGPKLRLKG